MAFNNFVYFVPTELRSMYVRKAFPAGKAFPPHGQLYRIEPSIPSHIYHTSSTLDKIIINFPPLLFLKLLPMSWVYVAETHILSEIPDYRPNSNFRNHVIMSGKCVYFKSEKLAIEYMLSHSSLTNSSGVILNSIMDVSDMRQISPFGPAWIIERSELSSPIDFDLRRRTLILGLFTEFQHLHIRTNHPVNIDGIIEINNGYYLIDKNVDISTLYKWMDNGSWVLYAANREGHYFSKKLERICGKANETSLKENDILLYLDSNTDNNSWYIIVNGELGKVEWGKYKKRFKRIKGEY